MNYIQVQIDGTDNEKNEILVALLENAGFESFEEMDTSLKAFIKEAEFDKTVLDEVIQPFNLTYDSTIVVQENWNAQWESSFEPILVNDFVGIRAYFHQPIPQVKHEIVITPKMSFGTGHHATTYMMIEQMETIDFNNKTVVDFGTGTAVLAILAEKMGASYIVAIDYDEWSIENSIENTGTNNCSKIELVKGETIEPGNFYDVVLANINLNVILSNLAAIKSSTKKGSFVLLSGFVKSDEELMLKNLAETGIYALKTLQKGDWICILAKAN